MLSCPPPVLRDSVRSPRAATGSVAAVCCVRAAVLILSGFLACRGEGWQRLRREDFSQVDLEEDSPELAELLLQMMRTEPDMRVSVEEVCAHPVVRRAREAMERMHAELLGAGCSTWGASPLAGVPAHFLEEILDREEEGAMDTSL